MKPYAIKIPDGAKDYLFEECSVRRGLERTLAALFAQRGFSEVILPSMEYYETFLQSGNNIPQEEMYKLIDRDGRILVLRPDLTTPIARVYAAKLKHSPLPQRLCYIQSVFRSGLSLRGKETEILQAGVELIGSSGIKSDLEVLTLAIASLEACGLQDFHIEIGHSGLFRALLRQLNCSEEVAEDIRRCTERKNYAALCDLIEPFGCSPAANSLKQLIELFGGEEILQEARTLAVDQDSIECIDSLSALYTELKSAGLADRIRFDLGLVNQIDYYTGIVFLGYTEGIGEPVLAGGRYDSLTACFGADAPAIGFGINVNAVSRCIPPIPYASQAYVIHYEKGMLGSALRFLETQTPGSCELSPWPDITQSIALARNRNAPRVVWFKESGDVAEFDLAEGEQTQWNG